MSTALALAASGAARCTKRKVEKTAAETWDTVVSVGRKRVRTEPPGTGAGTPSGPVGGGVGGGGLDSGILGAALR